MTDPRTNNTNTKPAHDLLPAQKTMGRGDDERKGNVSNAEKHDHGRHHPRDNNRFMPNNTYMLLQTKGPMNPMMVMMIIIMKTQTPHSAKQKTAEIIIRPQIHAQQALNRMSCACMHAQTNMPARQGGL